jgi:hypothetical protein
MMMRLSGLASIVAVVTGLAVVSPTPGATPQSRLAESVASCLPDSAQDVNIIRTNLADILGGSTSNDSIFRAVTDLPQVGINDIQIVQTDSICTAAAAALATAWGSGSPSDSTWVVRVGSARYLVFNLKQISGGRASGLVFDTNFVHLASFVL